MHEMSIVQHIIEVVLAETAKRNDMSIAEIGIRVGDLSGVDPDALIFTFNIAARETSLADTELLIERIPVRGECRKCGQNFIINHSKFICPSCNQRELTIIEGEELEIAYITERDK